MKENNSIQIAPTEINRIINLGCSMKIIFMQIDGIKIVEDIIKIIRKMNAPSFLYKQYLDQALTNFMKKMPGSESDFDLSSKRQIRKTEKPRFQQGQVENLQGSRQQLIQAIVQQLYNARQDALKLEQQDSSLAIGSMQPNQAEVDKEINQYVGQYKKDIDNGKIQIQELNKSVAKLQAQNKYYKKMSEDLGKASQQKDDKIQSLKGTISKLEELIIKNVIAHNQGELKQNISQMNKKSSQTSNVQSWGRNDSLIKSQGLQREVVKLKSQNESLRLNLAQSTILIKKESQKQKMISSQMESQFFVLQKQYALMKKEASDCIKQEKMRRVQDVYSSDQSDTSQSEDLNFKVEYDILKEKHNSLSTAYTKLKECYDKLSSSKVQRKGSNAPQFSEQNLDKESKNNKNTKNTSDSKSNKMKISKKRLDFDSDSEIMKDINDINRFDSMTEPIGINSFEEIINSKDMTNKIQGFQYNNSIIHKVNSSKFIQTFQAKLSLVLQYVCILELYFAKSFLSCIREELMMEDSITIKTITTADLNANLYVETPHQQTSFNANNSSKLSSMSSPNRTSPNDRVVSQQSNRNLSPIDDLSESAISLPNPSIQSPKKQKTRQRIELLEMQMKQISSFITDEYLNPHELREDPEFISRVEKLKQNRIAVVITNLVKQNEIFKKCLNQMIKSQQNLTQQNNTVYFEEGKTKKQIGSSYSQELKMKDKQNCIVM